MASSLAEAGVSGVIIPDLPLEEVAPWAEAADAAGVATVLLVAPSTPPERIVRITERCRGFVYGVGRMGVTGEQAELAGSAREVAARGITVNAIAPGVAAALAATVAGLAVAIPALFGYNWLNTRIKSISADNRVFVDEFVTLLAEQYS